MARLRGQGRDWILEFLRVLELRRAHQRRSAGIIEDFTRLATGFAACHTDDDAHRLFGAAFSLYGSRHHSLPYDEVEPLDPALPIEANPAVTISPSLRARNAVRSKAREKPVADLSSQRAEALREQVALAHEYRLLREALLRDKVVALSSYGTLDPRQFAELMDPLCAAITTHTDASGVRTSVSTDDQVVITVHDPVTSRPARLHTRDGVLTVPDYRIAIRLHSRRVASSRKDSSRAQPRL